VNEIQTIQSKIYEIRGQRVMLDRDLAAIYGVETKALNQSVKSNIKRFEGDDFMFRLTKDEVQSARSRSQIVTLNKRGSNIKYLPYAFTELGVAMLSSVLKSETAISTALTELQAKEPRKRERRPIGFIVPDEKKE